MRPERRFWLRLSLIYGIPVRELQKRIDSEEFTELFAFAMVEGLPGDGWRQAGQICATIANANRSGGPRAKPTDFMPSATPQLEDMDEVENAFRMQAMRVM